MSKAPELDLDWASDDVNSLRKAYAGEREEYIKDAPKDVDVKRFSVLGVGGLLFSPSEIRSSTPILYFHGGAWMVGSPRTHRTLCAVLAKVSGRHVISASYRLAPEHQFPTQKVDAVMAVNAVLQGRVAPFDTPLRVALAGDSAGAAMALWAEAGLNARQRGQIEQVICLYGAFGLRDSDSLRRLGPTTPGLSAKDVAAFYDRLGPNTPENFTSTFAALGAPLTLLIPENDPLADDSRGLAAWAEKQGRRVHVVDAAGYGHGFMHTAGRDARAAELLKTACSQLKPLYQR